MEADASLRKMASAGRTATVVALVREGSANVDGVDANGQSALAAAVPNGHTAAVAAIYALKGLSLHDACAREDVKRVCALINNKADVQVQDVESTTVLMAAVVAGQSCIVELLLAAGASCEVTDKESRTVLMIARANKYAAAAEMLMMPTAVAGALDVQDKDGSTALLMAIRMGLMHIVFKLLEFGANPWLIDEDGKNALDMCSDDEQACKSLLRDMGVRHSLFYAAANGLTDQVAALISEKADLKNKHGMTASLLACVTGHKEAATISCCPRSLLARSIVALRFLIVLRVTKATLP